MFVADFEANLLRLIDAITNGTKIEVNQTGKTTVTLSTEKACKEVLSYIINESRNAL